MCVERQVSRMRQFPLIVNIRNNGFGITFSNELSVIEWKKSDRLKASLAATYDAPLQLCAYLGAINADPRYRFEHVRSGVVVVAYTTGVPAHSFRLSAKAVQQYWTAWLERLHEYWVRRRNGTLPEPI